MQENIIFLLMFAKINFLFQKAIGKLLVFKSGKYLNITKKYPLICTVSL